MPSCCPIGMFLTIGTQSALIFTDRLKAFIAALLIKRVPILIPKLIIKPD